MKCYSYVKAAKTMEKFIKEKMKNARFEYDKRNYAFYAYRIYKYLFVFCRYKRELVKSDATTSWCMPVGIECKISQDFCNEAQRKAGNKSVHKVLKIIKSINEECKNKLEELL